MSVCKPKPMAALVCDVCGRPKPPSFTGAERGAPGTLVVVCSATCRETRRGLLKKLKAVGMEELNRKGIKL